MRIDPTLMASRVAATSPAAAAGSLRDRPRFALEDGRPTARPGGPRSVATLDTMAAIIALQEQEGESDTGRRKRKASRGRDLLDGLDRLKLALLSGRLAPADLGRLRTLIARAAGPTGDPALDDIMASIELRAEVELAKLAAAGVAV